MIYVMPGARTFRSYCPRRLGRQPWRGPQPWSGAPSAPHPPTRPTLLPQALHRKDARRQRQSGRLDEREPVDRGRCRRQTAAHFVKREMRGGRAQCPKQKWGPALLPAPTCTELRICRCSLAWLPEGPPLFDPGSPAQASLPIVVQPEGWFSIFRGPSWADPFRVACSQGEPRTATGRPALPAPLPVGPTWAEALLIAIRWRSVLPSPAAPSCRCRPSDEAGTSVPIT